ncbi:MAG: hypothetical protein AAFX87_11705 [Bacteroidota bacterium]
MTKSRRILFIFWLSLICFYAKAQTGLQTSDSTYYQHWIGKWYKFEGGNLANAPTFIVKRGLYHSSFEEYWIGAGGGFSTAWRAWDSRTQQWDFAWMSIDALFQLWEGKKIKGIWYMYRMFIIDEKEVISRQAFIPKGQNELVRTSEHSRDGGKTWQLRFKETYRKR